MKKTLLVTVACLLALPCLAAPARNVRKVGPEQNLFQVVRDVGPPALIVCEPGTYTKGVTNLFRNGVDWHFENCVIEHTDIPTNTSGCGIFDDRHSLHSDGRAIASGAREGVTSAITGILEIHYSTGTNVWVDPADIAYGYNTNALAAIVVTNPASLIKISASIDAQVYGIAPIPRVLYVGNCASNSYFGRFDRVSIWRAPGVLYTNGGYNVILRTNYLTPDDLIAPVGVSFMRWNEGTMACDAGNIDVTDYALDCYNNLALNTELFFTANRVSGKYYIVGLVPGWKVWSRVQEHLAPSTGNANAINCYGAGSHYFEAMKISCASGPVLQMELPQAQTNTNLVVWVNFDKMTGSNGWVNVKHGILRGRVGHFEWNGPPADERAGITTTNISSYVSLSGEAMYAPRTAVRHEGGRMELFNYRIMSTNRDPVYTSIPTNLWLHSTVLIPGIGGATNSIRAPSAAVVNITHISQRTNAHSNVTYSAPTNAVTDARIIN